MCPFVYLTYVLIFPQMMQQRKCWPAWIDTHREQESSADINCFHVLLLYIWFVMSSPFWILLKVILSYCVWSCWFVFQGSLVLSLHLFPCQSSPPYTVFYLGLLVSYPNSQFKCCSGHSFLMSLVTLFLLNMQLLLGSHSCSLQTIIPWETSMFWGFPCFLGYQYLNILSQQQPQMVSDQLEQMVYG